MEVILGVVSLIALAVVVKVFRRYLRVKYLLEKYSDREIVDDIMRTLIWQGMSQEQLIDSWGEPVEVGVKLLKTKRVETYKYNKIGRGRYKSRVYLEGGKVTGWEKK